MKHGAWIWLVLGLCVVACAEDEPTPAEPVEFEVNEGDPCNWAGASCIDDSELLRCVEGYWTAQGCDGYCASLGPGVSSPGCDVELALGSPAQLCTCEPPADGCYPGQGACEDGDSITWCADDWTWTMSACAEVCEARELLSLGCDSIGEYAVCLCTNTGTPCADEPPVCATDSILSACEDGLWVETDCAELCGAPAPCNPAAAGAAAGGAACAC